MPDVLSSPVGFSSPELQATQRVSQLPAGIHAEGGEGVSDSGRADSRSMVAKVISRVRVGDTSATVDFIKSELCRSRVV